MFFNNDRYLKELSFKGLEKRGLSDKENYINRLNEELDVIINCGLSDFMLLVSYTCLWCKTNGIMLGDGRGSVGGSLVAYCLKITEIDPIKYELSFARFLNESRMKTSLADIDIDVPRHERQRILEFLREKFGINRTCQIVNRIYYTNKTAFKDLCRIYGIDFQTANQLTNLMVDDVDIYQIPQIVEFFKSHEDIARLFPKIKGLVKAYGVHAGGFLISDKDIENYIGFLQVNGTLVSCYDGRMCEDQGFLKQDILGVNTLTVVQNCLNLIGKTSFDFEYDLDDPKVYETINKSCLGIFQLEGPAGVDYVSKMKPNCFEDIVAALALIRPGARDSGDADEFLKVRFGGKNIKYDHPLLESILERTNGAILYQEQAMQISRVLAGFTDIEADILRKGIGKKLDYIFEEYKPKFINGCIDNGVSEKIANIVWDKIEKSSSYSFNKSHSVGYALLTYKTAYLKTYYPNEFFIAMLMDEKKEEKRMEILNSIKKSGASLCNPDINMSKNETYLIDNKIYMGLNLIDKVSDKVSEAIINERKNGKFKSFDDFCARVPPRKCNKRVKQNLIWAGAFDNISIK